MPPLQNYNDSERTANNDDNNKMKDVEQSYNNRNEAQLTNHTNSRELSREYFYALLFSLIFGVISIIAIICYTIWSICHDV